ncbi:GGDEF domain-containing protein [Pseudomonadota bacterium AL_CKDN230030165-1A_HGKHYDSX7]
MLLLILGLAIASGLISFGNTQRLKTAVSERLEDLGREIEHLDSERLTDHLTGLGNKRALSHALLQPALLSQHYTVLALDIDHFKQVNDRWGHDVGDVVLAGFGRVVSSALRPHDLPFRSGGEEFVIVLPRTGLYDALAIAQRIRAAVEAEPVGEGAPPITVSIGAAACAGEGVRPEDVLRAADEVLYDAKRGGRNKVVAHRSMANREASYQEQV